MIFYDWITCEQYHPNEEVPQVGKHAYQKYDLETFELLGEGVSPLKAEGSFSTSINLSIRDKTIRLDGNVGRFGRLDNLFGITSIDALISACNDILKNIHPDMPLFTKGKRFLFHSGEDGKRVTKTSDGCLIRRLDVTSNNSVGEGNVNDYLRSLSVLPFRNMNGFLFPNGKAVKWSSKEGNNNLLYPSIYDKANEVKLHQYAKAARKYGKSSPECKYLKTLINYCESHGVARHEVKYKADFLHRTGFKYYGLFKENDLKNEFRKFIDLDKKAGGISMSYENLAEKLYRMGIAPSLKAATTTMSYYSLWKCNKQFDFNGGTMKTHRARLRKLGIDIAKPYDQSMCSDVFVTEQREIIRKPLEMPDWYVKPDRQQLKLVA